MITVIRFCLISMVCAIAAGCATPPDVLYVLKSSSQKKLERADKDLTKAQEKLRENRKTGVAEVNMPDMSDPNEVTTKIAEYRRSFLDERRLYVEELVAEYKKCEAELEMKSRNDGYLALGTKGIGILAGIASAILVTASPANAATVAGLGALSSGSAAFQDTASSVGYSTVIADGRLEALRTAVNAAYGGLKDVPWEYLYSYAGYAPRDEWDNKMKLLGATIVSIETAIRFPKYEIKVTTTVLK